MIKGSRVFFGTRQTVRTETIVKIHICKVSLSKKQLQVIIVSLSGIITLSIYLLYFCIMKMHYTQLLYQSKRTTFIDFD